MTRTVKFLLLPALIAALLLACGSGGQSETGSAGSPQASTGSIRIEHSLGTLELEAPARKVVVLEWTYAEDLLAVGIQPAGVSDIAGYKKWVLTEPTLASSVVDVGTRQQPSLEQIAALAPDLIIGVKFRHEGTYKDLSAIAPTLIFDPYPAEGQGSQYEEMEETFQAIASAVGKNEQAQAVLKDLHAKYDEASKLLAAADLKTKEFALVQAFTAQGAPTMRLFTNNSLAVGILEKIGLENAHKGGWELYGFSTGGVETLVAVQDANFFYVVQDDDNIFATSLKENPVWTNLNFVKSGRLYSLGGDTWVFGGPLSAELLVDKVVTALTKQS